jgi:hypothetical protein
MYKWISYTYEQAYIVLFYLNLSTQILEIYERRNVNAR